MADVYDAFNQQKMDLSRESHDKRRYQENHSSINISDIHHGYRNMILGYLLYYFVKGPLPFFWIVGCYHLSSTVFFYLTWKFHTYEYKRETWETKNYLDGELREMVDIYVKRYKVSPDDAWMILESMSRYQKLFIDHMMVLELDIKPPKIKFEEFSSACTKYTLSGIGGMIGGYGISHLPLLISLPVINTMAISYFYRINTSFTLYTIAKYCAEMTCFFSIISWFA